MSDFPEFDALNQLVQSKSPETQTTGIPEFDDLNDLVQNQSSSILPGKTKVTQKTGDYNPIEPTGDHRALDTNFTASPNTPVSLPHGKWQIVKAYTKANPQGRAGDYSDNTGWGNDVWAKNTQTGDTLHLLHLAGVHVQPGQTIEGNSVIGTSGSSGNATGPNLGVEYYDQNNALKPVLESPYKGSFQIDQGTSVAGKGGGGLLSIFHKKEEHKGRTIPHHYIPVKEGDKILRYIPMDRPLDPSSLQTAIKKNKTGYFLNH